MKPPVLPVISTSLGQRASVTCSGCGRDSLVSPLSAKWWLKEVFGKVLWCCDYVIGFLLCMNCLFSYVVCMNSTCLPAQFRDKIMSGDHGDWSVQVHCAAKWLHNVPVQSFLLHNVFKKGKLQSPWSPFSNYPFMILHVSLWLHLWCCLCTDTNALIL